VSTDSISNIWGKDYKAFYRLFPNPFYQFICFLTLPHLLLFPEVISYHKI